MFNVCPHCGMYCEEKEIDPAGPFAVCPNCGHRHPFRQLPLFALTGASGAGKSAICLELAAGLHGYVPLEADMLWRSEFATPEDDYRSFRNLCLRMAKNVGQAGRPVLLCGTAIPAQFEACPERRYLAAIHYLTLVCDNTELERRLKARPAWRNSASDEFIQRMLDFNAWLKANAARTDPPMELLDTTSLSLAGSTAQVDAWVRRHLGV